MVSKKIELYVGLFVLCGIVAIVFLALRAGNLSSWNLFQHQYHVTASFNNIGSLKNNAAVKSSGVTVGRVKSIHFDNKNFRAVVDIAIDDQYKFPDDSSASINTAGLLGDQYISLTPGADDQTWHDGSHIQYTQGAIVLEDLVSKFLFSKAAGEGKKQ